MRDLRARSADRASTGGRGFIATARTLPAPPFSVAGRDRPAVSDRTPGNLPAAVPEREEDPRSVSTGAEQSNATSFGAVSPKVGGGSSASDTNAGSRRGPLCHSGYRHPPWRQVINRQYNTALVLRLGSRGLPSATLSMTPRQGEEGKLSLYDGSSASMRGWLRYRIGIPGSCIHLARGFSGVRIPKRDPRISPSAALPLPLSGVSSLFGR